MFSMKICKIYNYSNNIEWVFRKQGGLNFGWFKTKNFLLQQFNSSNTDSNKPVNNRTPELPSGNKQLWMSRKRLFDSDEDDQNVEPNQASKNFLSIPTTKKGKLQYLDSCLLIHLYGLTSFKLWSVMIEVSLWRSKMCDSILILSLMN